jgi:PAS domain-containing protein
VAGVVRVTAMVQDITDRRRAETALRKSEERLRLATSAAQMETWELDLQHANGRRGTPAHGGAAQLRT